jgi:hypothetical protein
MVIDPRDESGTLFSTCTTAAGKAMLLMVKVTSTGAAMPLPCMITVSPPSNEPTLGTNG